MCGEHTKIIKHYDASVPRRINDDYEEKYPKKKLDIEGSRLVG